MRISIIQFDGVTLSNGATTTPKLHVQVTLSDGRSGASDFAPLDSYHRHSREFLTARAIAVAIERAESGCEYVPGAPLLNIVDEYAKILERDMPAPKAA